MYEKLLYASLVVNVLIIVFFIFYVRRLKKKHKEEREQEIADWRYAMGDLANKSRVITVKFTLASIKEMFDAELVASVPITSPEKCYVQVFRLAEDGTRAEEIFKRLIVNGHITSQIRRSIDDMSGGRSMQIIKRGKLVETTELVKVVNPIHTYVWLQKYTEKGSIDFCEGVFKVSYSIDHNGHLCLTDFRGPDSVREDFMEYLLDELGDIVGQTTTGSFPIYTITELTPPEGYKEVMKLVERTSADIFLKKTEAKEPVFDSK